jgi:uncharacterized membrane protein YecN with MAPEG domain
MHLITTALTASALALLLVFLSITTIRMRMKHSAAFGDAGQQALTSAIRAHGNLTEYAPMGVILIGLLEANGAAHMPLAITAGAFVVARVLNAIGLFNPPGPPPLTRSIGIVATLLILLGLAIWLLVLIHLPMLR